MDSQHVESTGRSLTTRNFNIQFFTIQIFFFLWSDKTKQKYDNEFWLHVNLEFW